MSTVRQKPEGLSKQIAGYLKELHDFETWQGKNNLEEDLFVWKFFLSGREFPDWHAHRIKPFKAKGKSPLTRSIWRYREGGSERLLKVEVLECSSRIVAHHSLLQLVGEFQSPLIERRMNLVGDVAFTVPGEYTIVFARANLVLLLASVGRDRVSVKDYATAFDNNLVSRPNGKEMKAMPEITVFKALTKEYRIGVPIPLEVKAMDVLKRPLWFKFFSLGETTLEEGKLIYRPAVKGLQRIKVFAINAEGSASSKELQLTVS